MNLFETLKDRNLLYQTTDEEKLKELLTNGKVTVYCGTDPTADSLHIGHCVPCTILRRFQQAGHKVVVLVGGATAAIGDPTGKTDMRPMLSQEQLEKNIEGIKRAYSTFLNFEGENPAIIVNNADWFKGYDYVNFMRNVGVHFNVNKMITNEIYAKRIEEGGLTFFEMGYMLMQAYDFYQGIYQTPDACVEMMFALFTDIPMDEVRNLVKNDIVNSKKRLAFEITKFIRGEEDAKLAEEMSANLFSSSQINKDNAPTFEIELAENKIGVLDLLLNAKFVQSKGEARRLIEQNGLSMDGETIKDASMMISKESLKNGILFKKGKKNFILIKC